MHAAAYQWIRFALARLTQPARVLEFGSRDINGTPRPLLPDAESYVGVDLVDGPGVDVVDDVADYHAAMPVDLVLCCEVLEHAKNAADIVRNAVACTAPGGHVLITCATTGRAPHSAVDGGPLREGEFYRNVTPEMLTAWIEAAPAFLTTLEINQQGDLYALAQVPA